MDVEIQLGSPRYHCDRFGICKIDEYNPLFFEKKEGKALANLQLKSNGTFILRFYRKSIMKDTYTKHFVNASFTVSTNAIPSGNIFNALGIVPFEIKEGIYPVKVTKSFLELTMQSFVAPNKINDSITTVNSS
jgi:hypothetical protein